MRQIILLFFCLFFRVVLFGQPLVNFNAEKKARGSANVYALVIGVAKYEDTNINQLLYSARDAEIFAEFLSTKAGGSVPKENIRLLTDSNATQGAIYESLYWLKGHREKGDIVYFYFSGHGDIEHLTNKAKGTLLCYNTLVKNRLGLSFRLDDLNDFAATLSDSLVDVVLITDACHSGRLVSKNSNEQQVDFNNKEIRITSSTAEQLSNEKEDWGGGRSVFSYYLVNGLKGLADTENDGEVTVLEIKRYLESALAKDPVLLRENIKQTPVVNGNLNYVLAKTVEEVKDSVLLVAREDSVRQQPMLTTLTKSTEDDIPASAEEYFFSLFKKKNLEELTDLLKLNDLAKDEVAFTLISALKSDFLSPEGDKKLDELEAELKANPQILNQFNYSLATVFDNRGHDVINQYLTGSAAELERRRYYNVNINGYDIYPRMFAVALKLLPADEIFYPNIIKYKMHYLSGVALRLKIPATENPRPLIEKALAEQRKALAYEENAANVYNEIGILYNYKGNDAEAEKYFITASNKEPGWAIPLANLADLYAFKGQLDKALVYADSAYKLQPGLLDISLNYGIIYEKQGKLLQAEEAFQKGLKYNKGHYLPFERLGYIYIKTTQWALANSMFIESDLRKNGFHFNEPRIARGIALPKIVPDKNLSAKEPFCFINSGSLQDNDLMAHFILGFQLNEKKDISAAELEFKKIITLDKKNPLAYHFLGKILMEQNRWQEGEFILKLAIENHLTEQLFNNYCDSLQKNMLDGLLDNCIVNKFRQSYYPKKEDYVMLATLYESWNQYNAAVYYYRKFIEADSTGYQGYLNLAKLYEKLGKYNDAEFTINEMIHKTGHKEDLVFNRFYDRVTALYPDQAEWNLKAGNFFYDHAMKSSGIRFLDKAAKQIRNNDKLIAIVNTRIGDLYSWDSKPDSAIYFYKKAIDLDHADAGTRNKLVEMYTKQYQYTDALIQLDSLFKRKEINYDNQLLLARFHLFDGRYNDAEKLLRSLENIKPGFDIALTSAKSNWAIMTKNSKQALGYYREIFNTNKNDSIVLYNMARTNAVMGNDSEAYTWLDLALENGFNFNHVLLHDPFFKKLRNSNKWAFLRKKYPEIFGP